MKDKYGWIDKKDKDKNAMDIDAITVTKALGSLSLHTILNLVSIYRYESNNGNNSNTNSYDSRASHSSEDFEKTLERRYYSNGLGY